MTRSITIVNTSNWEHENYVLKHVRKEVDKNGVTVLADVTLKPGESFSFTPANNEDVRFVEDEPLKPEPFHGPAISHRPGFGQSLTRKQLIPHVKVTLE